PLAVMGLREGENLFLNEKKLFVSRYVPAFIRRYPFVLGGNKDSEMMAICVDEDSKLFVHNGSVGERLFEDNGEQSVHLKEIVEFLKDYQQRAEITKIFCKRLHDLDLLEPMQANITFKNNEAANINLTGFYVVKREKLRALSDADILDIFKKDGMEIIYAHMQSLSNLNRLIELMPSK
ncbi:MAG: multidrug transporter, partial [Flavobacterium sp.]